MDNATFLFPMPTSSPSLPARENSIALFGLKDDGSIVVWGNNSSDVPTPNSGFVAISAGERHNLGLKQDGDVVAWGDNAYAQCDVPDPNTTFASMAAGSTHNLALRQDGSLVAWGNNEYFQCGVAAPNAGFVAFSAGFNHAMALRRRFLLVAWGDNCRASATSPFPIPDSSPSPPGEGIASHSETKLYHRLGLQLWRPMRCPCPQFRLHLYCRRLRAQSGDQDETAQLLVGEQLLGQCDVPSPNTGFVAIAVGWYHSLALRHDGSVVAWGRNSWG